MFSKTSQEYLWALFAKKTFNHDKQLSLIRKHFPLHKFPSLLEIASGAGIFLGDVEETGYSCTGLDINGERISLATILNKTRSGNCNFSACNAGDFTSSEKFDGAFWMNVPLDIDTLINEFIDCATRCIRPNGRIVFDYLISTTQNSEVGVESWVDDLIHDGDDLLPRGHYQRTVVIDYSTIPWHVSWDICHAGHDKNGLSFSCAYDVPVVNHDEVRQKVTAKGWTHIQEIDCGDIVLDGRPSGFGFKTELFEKIKT